MKIPIARITTDMGITSPMISDLLSEEGAELIVGKLAETFKSNLPCY